MNINENGYEVGEKMDNKNFHTFREYMKKDDNFLTASMEDYLEMIYRLSAETGFTRINALSQALNVQPPSATKMVQHLAGLQLVKYERYGVVLLTEKGNELGLKLLNRHIIIEAFMKVIDLDNEKALEETEKIEHVLSDETILSIRNYVDFVKSNPDIWDRFQVFKYDKKAT